MTRWRTAASALIAAGVLVLAGPVLLLVWMHRMYTTGVSIDLATGPLLPLWLGGGIGMIVAGVLLRRARTSRS
ncbi:hypothetical protein [Sphingomonas bacterium]|uniref:hypothetical protein n=1 Tax=Sphingomonas bacterium TaxID=1895847 RepID=UPI001575B91A|nr:hypothetical protein [Sphingomonas bacterium]